MSDKFHFTLLTKENQPRFNFHVNEKMDPRCPSFIEARNANSEYIIYYDRITINNGGIWNFTRVSDGAVVASGDLYAMLALLSLYENSRRATWAEDVARMKPYYLSSHAVESEKRLLKVFDGLAK